MSGRTDIEASESQASTGITPETLRTTLSTKLAATHVDIQDLSGESQPIHILPILDLFLSGKPQSCSD